MHRLLAALRPTPAAGRAERVELCLEPALDTRCLDSADAGAPPELPGACGWFDSSHALQHGLCVTEHVSADAVVADLPLADWLQLHLCGWVALPAAPTVRLAGPPPR